jgi:hypothetical protein
MFQADEADLDAVNFVNVTMGIAVSEIDARDIREELYTHRRETHAYDFVFLEEEVGGQFRNGKAKFTQGYEKLVSIFGVDGYPYIHVVCGSRIAVVADGKTANEQVFNLVIVQQLQELFEVVR